MFSTSSLISPRMLPLEADVLGGRRSPSCCGAGVRTSPSVRGSVPSVNGAGGDERGAVQPDAGAAWLDACSPSRRRRDALVARAVGFGFARAGVRARACG